jgi:hypothetical protein
MKDTSRQRRDTRDAKRSGEDYKVEKNRMDYEGGNQGNESARPDRERKDVDDKKIPDRNSARSTNRDDQQRS